MPKSKPRKKTAAKKGAAAPRLSVEDIEALLAALGGLQDGDELEEFDDLDRAQEIIYDAWGVRGRGQRAAMAKKALAISPLCADAYALLAADARHNDEAIALYRQGVEAGERAVGEAAFEEDVGHFWGLFETRPYMRARHGLAMALWQAGEQEAAIAHYQDMLRLNPNDNQGIRYILLDALLALGRDDDAGALIRRYKHDGSAAWDWSRALLSFRRKCDCATSRKALARAIDNNAHVMGYLLGHKKLPRTLPDYYGIGDAREAVVYLHTAMQPWKGTPGALAWVEAAAGDLPARSRKRA